MSRRHLTQVFRLCCLAAKDSCADLPEIIIALDGCAVPASVVTSCVKGVQSLVSSASYKQGAFFTEGTMESVQEYIARSREFMVSSAFDPWEGIAQIGRLEFVARHVSAFDVYLARKKKEAEEGLYGANRSSQRKQLSSSSSSPGAAFGSFPGASLLPKSVFGFNSPAVVSKDCASSGSPKGGKESPRVSLSALLKRGKTDEKLDKSSAKPLRRSGRGSSKESGKKSDDSSCASGKSSAKNRASGSKLWFELFL